MPKRFAVMDVAVASALRVQKLVCQYLNQVSAEQLKTAPRSLHIRSLTL